MTASYCQKQNRIKKPMPLWLTTVIAVTFAVLYIIERIAQFIKESKDDRDI